MMLENIHLIPLLPLASALIIFFFGDFLPMRGAFLGILAMAVNFVWAAILFLQGLSQSLPLPYQASVSWFTVGPYTAELGVLVDPLTVSMLVVVTLVSLLVQIYSVGYMHDDPRFKRYYAYLSLFTFAMLGLVVSNNILQTLVCWEIMGVSSYLLIGFWFEKQSAAYAGRKAFITTRVGDLGFLIGVLLLFSHAGTFNFTQLSDHVQNGFLPATIAGAAGLCLFWGAMGKSAQFPLHVWLPDAMEGPTPVSALIHAATMVAAGVFLVARNYFLFQALPWTLDVVAAVGLFTAALAATMALVSTDIKQVLAFSTISQLGYMMLGLGVGGYTAGVFHLVTHAFFKALLFLGAGSVIHAMHTNDLRKMGGLLKKMPVTGVTFLCGCLALSGFPFLSGYYSKDAILAQVYHHSPPFFYVAVAVAALTAFYTFRLYFMTFAGEPRDAEAHGHAHESPFSMTGPLIVLAFLAVLAGYSIHESFSAFVVLPGALEEHHGWLVPLVSSVAALGGIGVAYLFYVTRSFSPELAAERAQGLHKLLKGRYFLDEAYLMVIVANVDRLGRFFFWTDSRLLDRIGVDGWGWLTELLSRVQKWLDVNVVDMAVNATGKITQEVGRVVRKFQTGFVQHYLFVLTFGMCVLIVWRLIYF